jgi:hypothetical protein
MEGGKGGGYPHNVVTSGYSHRNGSPHTRYRGNICSMPLTVWRVLPCNTTDAPTHDTGLQQPKSPLHNWAHPRCQHLPRRVHSRLARSCVIRWQAVLLAPISLVIPNKLDNGIN